jgi:uncharacterized coiled-coil DUF342 family protein
MWKHLPASKGLIVARKMTAEHKKALAEGRRQAKAVRDYLEALNTDRRSTTDPKQLQKRIGDLEQKISAEENPSKRVELVQKRLDLEQQLSTAEEAADLNTLEKDFKKAVKGYSERKGIGYKAWREVGVPAGVLKSAGLSR